MASVECAAPLAGMSEGACLRFAQLTVFLDFSCPQAIGTQSQDHRWFPWVILMIEAFEQSLISP